MLFNNRQSPPPLQYSIFPKILYYSAKNYDIALIPFQFQPSTPTLKTKIGEGDLIQKLFLKQM